MGKVEVAKAGGTRRPLERIIRIHEAVNRGNFPNCHSIARELEVNRKTIPAADTATKSPWRSRRAPLRSG